jgi:hypothetical protein
MYQQAHVQAHWGYFSKKTGANFHHAAHDPLNAPARGGLGCFHVNGRMLVNIEQDTTCGFNIKE